MKFSFNRKGTLLLLAFICASAFWLQWSTFQEIRISLPIVQNRTVNISEKEAEHFEMLQRRMDSRLNHINNICNSDTVGHFRKIFKFKSHQEVLLTLNGTGICMCKVPKASSTFLGKVLLMLQDRDTPEEIKRMSGFDIHGRMFATYGQTCDFETEPIFLVTRNPFTRLFSGYIDKVFIPKFWRLALSLHHFANQKNRSIQSVHKFIDSETAKGDCYKDDVSFDMFLRYVVSTIHMDPHFTPVSMLCDPCKWNYTTLIKQENFKEETIFMLENFRVRPDIQAAIVPLLEEELVERSVQNLFDTVRQTLEVAKTKHGCKIPFFMYLRVWQAIQILGYVDSSEPFPFHVFSQGLKGAYKKLKDYNIKFLNSTQRKIQRYEYLKLAYKSVNPRTVVRVQQLFQLDFLMFDYDTTPPA